MLLISIALGFQVLFVSSLTYAHWQVQKQFEEEAHSRRLLSKGNALLLSLLRLAGAQGMYQFNKDPRFREQYEEGLTKLVGATKELRAMQAKGTGDAASADVSVLAQTVERTLELFQQAKEVFESEDQEGMKLALFNVAREMPKLERLNLQFMERQEQRGRVAAKAEDDARKFVQTVVYGGLAANIFVVVALLAWFNTTTSRRFNILSRNIFSLGANESLTAPIPGSDEIAQLDSVVHEVSDALIIARKKEQAMIQNAVDVICTLDKDGKFHNVNNAAQRIWGREPEDLIGSSFKNIIAREDWEATDEALQNLINGEGAGVSGSFENHVRHGDGNLVDALWTAFWSAEEKRLFCVVHDISARKEAERLKQEVLAMVTHDLRSPLTSLQLTLNVLQSGSVDGSSEKAKLMLGRAEMSVGKLIQLINDLLDIDRIESGKFALDIAKVKDEVMISQSTDLIHHMAESRNIEIETLASGGELECDEERIVRVLTNLLSNAIKFSPEGSKVTISTREENGHVEFYIVDRGRGLPQEEQELIFERYHQVNRSDAAEKKGSGLGLTICKAIVEAHHGTIGATSQAGEGSTFWFRLPRENSSNTDKG